MGNILDIVVTNVEFLKEMKFSSIYLFQRQ